MVIIPIIKQSWIDWDGSGTFDADEDYDLGLL